MLTLLFVYFITYTMDSCDAAYPLPVPFQFCCALSLSKQLISSSQVWRFKAPGLALITQQVNTAQATTKTHHHL
jgi:hypothetical protein